MQPLLQVDDVVGDGYVVEGFVAGGGMGQVYVARDPRLDRHVAVKLLHPQIAASPTAAARFQLEARALSRVVHPNVVAIHGFGRHGAGWYLVMEYIEGESLEHRLERSGRLSLADTLTVTRQVASGLAEAHALGLVHRDVKPGNILLRNLASGGQLAKVVDFGLASQQGGGRAQDVGILGTPAYMSPEQIRGKPLDGRSDLYSLAVVVYQMLTGRLPYFRDTVQATLEAHLEAAPPPLGPPAGDEPWPAAFERELLRGLAKSPDERPASTLEFAAALDRSAHTDGLGGGPTHCPGCGDDVSESGGFCVHCGSAVPMPTCATCGAVQAGERYFCVDCGTSLLLPMRRSAIRKAPRQARKSSSRMLTASTVAVVVARLEALGLDAAQHTEFAATFLACVEREGGRPIGLVGRDAVAVFGLGGMRERELEAAVDAALNLHLTLARLGAGQPVLVRVGIDFGPVHTRGLGVAWGAALMAGAGIERARAAAMEAEPGVVCVTENAFREIRGLFETVALTAQYRRVDRRRDSARAHADYTGRGASIALIGRRAESEHLTRAAREAVRDTTLAIVPIIGPAGAGKSRLCGEFLRRIEDEDGWQFDVGHCSSTGIGLGYEPFVEMIRRRVKADEPGVDVQARLARLPGIATSGDAEQVNRRVKSLARLIGLDQPADDSRPDTTGRSTRPATAAEQQAAFEAYLAYVRGLCAQRPLVVVIENLQWARRPTLELLEHLVRNAEDLPLVLLLVLRPERAPAVLGSIGLPAARTIPLDVAPLELGDVAALIGALRPGARVSEDLARTVNTFADGLPGRIEETVDALTSDGVFTRAPIGWDAHDLVLAHAVSGKSLSDLVVGRISRLAPSERALLEAVAVAGRQAPKGMIAAMLRHEPAEAEIDAVKQAGFLVETRVPRFRGQREFEFRQARLGEVLAASLAPTLAAEQRRSAARWLIAWRDVKPPGYGAMLAHYLLVAGDEARAVGYLLQAAGEALRALANRDAFETFGAAADVARDIMEKTGTIADTLVLVQALLGRAEVGQRLGEPDAAVAAATEADERTRALGPGLWSLRVQALILHGIVLGDAGRYDDALLHLAEASALAGERSEGVAQAAQASSQIARIHVRRGNMEAAEAVSRAGLVAWGRLADSKDAELVSALGRMHTWIGHAASRRREFDEAATEYDAARRCFAHANDEGAVLMTDLSMGNLAYRCGDLDRAATLYADTAARCTAFDYVQGLAIAQTNLGNVLLDQSRHKEALATLRDAEKTIRRLGALDMLPEALRLIGLVLLTQGDAHGARQAGEEALAIAGHLGNAAAVQAAQAVLDQAAILADTLSAATLEMPDAER